ncbi:MAG: hypothetical protein ACLPY1_18550 [Terracidiphilus sp.]
MIDCPVDISKMLPVGSIEGDSDADTELLLEMAAEALQFLSDHDWCEGVTEQYLAYGVGGVVSVFLFHIASHFDGVDPWLWVIVGDIPPAYIVVEDNPSVADALDGYCTEMTEWAEAIEAGESIEDLIPVNGAPTIENARALIGRIQFLRSEIIPLTKAV